MTAKNDEKIKLLLEKAESQKAALGTKPRASWDTNAIFKYSVSSTGSPKEGQWFNINAIRDPQTFVEALAFLLERDHLHTQAAGRLGVTVKPLMWDGYPVSAWEHDFKLRIEIINWENRKTQLEDTQKKLKALVSDEGKTEMELANLEGLLG